MKQIREAFVKVVKEENSVEAVHLDRRRGWARKDWKGAGIQEQSRCRKGVIVRGVYVGGWPR